MIQKVSVHGGHSASYCFHAKDALEDIILTYIKAGYSWVGITEHMPPISDKWIYSFERPFGWNAIRMKDSFRRYGDRLHYLKEKYRNDIEILVAFETEWYEGCLEAIEYWIHAIKPDYIVGSVHHMAGIEMDTSPKTYGQCISAYGSKQALYCAYFDAQYALMEAFNPSVIGHMDLVRIFDAEYKKTLLLPDVWERIERNLAYVKKHNLILDFNLRALVKGQPEPYISLPILNKAIEMDVAVVPGDDSHGIGGVGNYWEKGIEILSANKARLNWNKPNAIL